MPFLLLGGLVLVACHPEPYRAPLTPLFADELDPGDPGGSADAGDAADPGAGADAGDGDGDGEGDGDPTSPALAVHIAASRVSGAAPLAVLFEAVVDLSSSPRPFHELSYRWDFDDGGKAETGPVVARLFEPTGSPTTRVYDVELTATDPLGHLATARVAVSVTTAEAAFPGTATLCACAVTCAGFPGCPPGAQQIVQPDLTTVFANAAPGRRILLHAGDTWTLTSQLTLNVAGPGLIGSFGGTPATIHVDMAAGGQPFRLSGQTPVIDDWRFVDLNIVADTAGLEDVFIGAGMVRALTFAHLQVNGFASVAELSVGVADWWNRHGYPGTHQLHRDLAFFDVDFTPTSGLDRWGYALAAERLIFVGNRIEDAGGTCTAGAQGMVKIEMADRGFVAGNTIAARLRALHVNGPGEAEAASLACSTSTRRIVISDNSLTSRCASFGVALVPIYNSTQRIEDALLERNHLRVAPSSEAGLLVDAWDVSARNNLVDISSVTFVPPRCFMIQRRTDEPPPITRALAADVDLVNNTCYGSGLAGIHLLGVFDIDSARLANNLVWAPGAANRYEVQGNDVADVELGTNLLATVNPFVVATPAGPADFDLADSVGAIDAGEPFAGVVEDYARRPRPAGADLDLGAYERQ